jgi:hypothetical protein
LVSNTGNLKEINADSRCNSPPKNIRGPTEKERDRLKTDRQTETQVSIRNELKHTEREREREGGREGGREGERERARARAPTDIELWAKRLGRLCTISIIYD